jgi:5'-nucleotidase
MRVLLTNDDGIEAEGLNALRRSLVRSTDLDLRVIAPDGDRSSFARAITTRRPMRVAEVQFDDDSVGYATDGNPVDCVRLAHLGLIDGWRPDLVVAGINHGANLGGDVTYSGTVAAALEAVVLGIPSIAVSQLPLESDPEEAAAHERFDFGVSAGLAAGLVGELGGITLPSGTLLNVNVPGAIPKGFAVAHLGKRRYRETLELVGHDRRGGRYLQTHSAVVREDESRQTGSDMVAVAAGWVSLTPVHFDLTYEPGLETLSGHDFNHLLADLVR